MNYYYCVAGFSFRLTAPDGYLASDLLWNYKPFVQEASAESELAFCCEICDTLPDGTAEQYYHDEPEEDDMPRIDIFRYSGGFLFVMYPSAHSFHSYKLWTNDDFSKGMLLKWNDSAAGRFPVDNALMLMFALRTASMSTLEMHASVVVKDDKGYLFLGKSGTGKSTHSRMWLESVPESSLLNDDNPVVRVTDDGEVRVFGSPWSGKTPCYVNRDFKVGGFVLIRQYPENIIERQSVLESYASLYTSCSGMKMNSKIADDIHCTIEKVIDSVPCWLLKCLPDGDAARVCYNSVRYGDDGAAE